MSGNQNGNKSGFGDWEEGYDDLGNKCETRFTAAGDLVIRYPEGEIPDNAKEHWLEKGGKEIKPELN